MELIFLAIFCFYFGWRLASFTDNKECNGGCNCKEDITKFTDNVFCQEYEKYRAEYVRRMKCRKKDVVSSRVGISAKNFTFKRS